MRALNWLKRYWGRLLTIFIVLLICMAATLAWKPFNLYGKWFFTPSQARVSTAQELRAAADTSTGRHLTDLDYEAFETIDDHNIPSVTGTSHFATIWTTCSATDSNATSGNKVIGSNYTKCGHDYVQQMTTSRPGVIVVNNSIVALILPDTATTYYWVAIPQNMSKPSVYQTLNFPSAKKAKTADLAAFSAIMKWVPIILDNYPSANIRVSPLGDTTAGTVPRDQLDLEIEKLLSQQNANA